MVVKSWVEDSGINSIIDSSGQELLKYNASLLCREAQDDITLTFGFQARREHRELQYSGHNTLFKNSLPSRGEYQCGAVIFVSSNSAHLFAQV